MMQTDNQHGQFRRFSPSEIGFVACSDASWTPIPIDRGHSFRLIVDRDSDAIVDTFSVWIGIGVHDRGISVHDVGITR